MIHVFYKNRNTIGQFMVALIFLGTFGFLFTYDGFVAESTATSCCGGGEAAVTSFAANSSGDYGSEILMDAEATDGCSGEDKIIPSSSNSTDCSCAGEGGDCGCSSPDKCDGAKGCGTGSYETCCYDNNGYVDCKCSKTCGGKGPTVCDTEYSPC